MQSIIVFSLFFAATAFAMPGTYSYYDFGGKAGLDQLSIVTQWLQVDDGAFVFAAHDFDFEAGPGGYIGTKNRGDKRWAAFSVWDTADATNTAIPAGANCGRFGGEGTGASCNIIYDWKIDGKYRLTVKRIGDEAVGTRWRGTVTDEATGVETSIGDIIFQNTGGYAGYGLLKQKTTAFVEFFRYPPNNCNPQPHVKLNWIGPYTSTGAVPLTSISEYTGCPNNEVSSPGKPVSTHEAGGNTKQIDPPKRNIW